MRELLLNSRYTVYIWDNKAIDVDIIGLVKDDNESCYRDITPIRSLVKSKYMIIGFLMTHVSVQHAKIVSIYSRYEIAQQLNTVRINDSYDCEVRNIDLSHNILSVA